MPKNMRLLMREGSGKAMVGSYKGYYRCLLAYVHFTQQHIVL